MKREPAPIAVWPKMVPLTVSGLSPLPGFESRPWQVRKLPETLFPGFR